MNPNFAGNFLRLTDLYFQTGKDEKALSTLKRAKQQFPNDPVLTYFLARGLAQLKHYEQALEEFGKAEKEGFLENSGQMEQEFYFQFGAVAERAKQYDRAEELFRKSIARDHSFHPAYNYLGYMWIEQNKNLEEAAQLIRRAIELDENNSAYIDSIGWYYYRIGNYKQALQHLLHAVSLAEAEAENWEIFDHIADVYLKLGQLQEAISYWKKAHALVPDNDSILHKLNAHTEASAVNQTVLPPNKTESPVKVTRSNSTATSKPQKFKAAQPKPRFAPAIQ